MKIQTERYLDAITHLPKTGQHILAHQDTEYIVVYQAYSHHIAEYALNNQVLGGDYYSYNRMSWIKPNFLWMMYRSGWASKENQERILAIWISKADFEAILQEAVLSSFNAAYYSSHEQWKSEMDKKEVRLQWDPDHDPYGNKLNRRAIQIGMKGGILEMFGKQQIKAIEDITEFVKEQKVHIDKKELNQLLVPVETVYTLKNESLGKRIGGF
jgi:hypothetical protein